MSRPPVTSPRTGRLVLPPQIVLADLEELPSALADELLEKVWPVVRRERESGEIIEGIEDKRVHRIAVCLLEFAGRELYERFDEDEEWDDDDGYQIIDSEWLRPSGPLWKYRQLGLSKETIALIARFHDRRTDGACRIADPLVGGGLEWTYDDHEDSWHKASPVGIVVDVQARTLALELELSSGGQDQCKASRPGPGPYPPADEAMKKLAERLRPRLQHLPSAVLADDVTVIAVLITSLAAYLDHGSLRRGIDKGRITGVRADLYEQLLDSLELGESRETVRRIVEAHHPDPIAVDLPLPSGGPRAIVRRAHLLHRQGPHLIPSRGEPAHLVGDHARDLDNLPDPEALTPISIYTNISIYREVTSRNKTDNDSSAIPRIPPVVPRRSGGPTPEDRGIAGAPEREIGEVRPPHHPQGLDGLGSTLLAIRPSWLRPTVSPASLRVKLTSGHLQRALREVCDRSTFLGVIYTELKRTSRESLRQVVSQELPMRTAEQLVNAAGIVFRELPGLYAEGLRAILCSEPPPWMGKYNRLAELPGLAGRLAGADRERVIDLVMSAIPMSKVEVIVELEFPPKKREALEIALRVDSHGTALVDLVGGVYGERISRAEAMKLLHDHRALAQGLIEELEGSVKQDHGEGPT